LFEKKKKISGMFNPWDCYFNLVGPTRQGIIGLSYASSEPGFNEILNKKFSVALCEVGGRMWIGNANTSLFSSPMNYANSSTGIFVLRFFNIYIYIFFYVFFLNQKKKDNFGK
jgi:hypothetical protein